MPRCLTAASLGTLVSAVLTITACGNSTGLGTGVYQNTVDTVSLYALDGTALDLPSGFIMFTGGSATGHAVRTDLTAAFDFAFNITPAGQAVLLPTGAMHLGIGTGFQTQHSSFGAITLAPGGVYVDSVAVPVDSGAVVALHSRLTTCPLGNASFYYGKLQVLAIDTLARRIDLQTLINQNCGYKSLAPGYPTQ